ncbi:F-box/kelch-repeat protein At1g57790-like [Rutidosis leptorrhynchoides]|uniref:F-box/kelch-repeat protein At1g57790-like n=1 Tax=Rutidosis leptorrhynchoides TaxID=125765 RepID=UPI003A9994A4
MSPIQHTDLSPTSYAIWSMPGCRLEGDYGEIKCDVESKQEEDNEYEVLVVNDERVFSFPFHVLELIMKFFVDIDYLNLRATCKQLGALPVIRWSNITEILRLRTYSLVSPWSMVLDTNRGIITITDPMLGNKYFIKPSQELVGDLLQIHCSAMGWLLMSNNTSDLMFFNPFTSDILKLPHLGTPHVDKFCFSAPPTSPGCMVFGLGSDRARIHFVGREQSWRTLQFSRVHSKPFRFQTFFGRDIYALNHQKLIVFRRDDFLQQRVVSYVPYNCHKPSTKYYLTKSNQHLLLVSVDVFEKSVEVHKWNQSTSKFEKLKSLGKDVIYVSETTCLCTEATTPKMENKVYFHQAYSENDTLLFYSLETGRFHALDDDNMQGSYGDLFKHKRLLRPHTWIC